MAETLNLNRAACNNKGNFVRKGGVTRGRTKNLILVLSSDNVFEDDDFADLEAALQAKAIAAYKDRAWIIGELGNPQDNGEAITYSTKDQKKSKSAPGTFDKIYTLLEGTECQYQQLEKLLNGRKFHFIIVDENNEAWAVETATGVRGFRGHELHMLNPTEATTSETVSYNLRVSASNIKEINGAVHFPLGFDVADIKTVEDVKLIDMTPQGGADGVHVVGIVGACDSCTEFNYAELFATELSTANAFPSVNNSNATCSITSVAPFAQAGKTVAMQLNFTTTDTDYVNGQPVFIGLPNMETIFNLVGRYWEAEKLQVTAHKS